MAPPKSSAPFSKDERVLCFHMDMLYEAKILDIKPTEANDAFLYKIHYKGWKSSWDDWVPEDRVRKFTDENRELASQLLAQYKSIQSGKPAKQPKNKALGGRAGGSDMSSARGSEERTQAATTLSGRGGQRRARDYDLDQEDNFHYRPAISIPLPDSLKGLLVDDWENVTKLQQLIPLPHAHSVDEILNEYLTQETPNRHPESADLDIVEETVDGLREYFNRCLGRILLYRFERAQYYDMHQLWTSDEDSKHTCPSDTYGAEHLARLLVSLPELIVQTTMDQQSVNRLREELIKFTNWFAQNATNYFVNEYETPGAEYVEQARSA